MTRKKKHRRPRFPTERHSSALAVFRKGSRGWEVLLMQQRYTYALADFMLGHFPSRGLEGARALLGHMHPNELLRLRDDGFERCWEHIWMGRADIYGRRHCVNKHRNLFTRPGQLAGMIGGVSVGNVQFPWVVPGGRIRAREPVLAAALRELREELGIHAADPLDVVPLLDVRHTLSKTDGPTTYLRRLTAAYAPPPASGGSRDEARASQKLHRPQVHLSNTTQLEEVGALQWVPLGDLEMYVGKSDAAALRALKKRMVEAMRLPAGA